MRTTKMKKAISKTRLLLAAMAALTLSTATAAFAAAPAITGQTFNLTAQDAHISQPDGAMVYSWGYGCNGAPTGFAPSAISGATCSSMQVPGPTLIVNEGDVVTVTLTNNLPTAAGNTSILFPGFQVINAQVTPTSTSTTVPANTPYVVSVSTSPTFVDNGVVYGAGGSLTRVTSSPSLGQYSVAGGTYTFSAADASAAVVINWSAATGASTGV